MFVPNKLHKRFRSIECRFPEPVAQSCWMSGFIGVKRWAWYAAAFGLCLQAIQNFVSMTIIWAAKLCKNVTLPAKDTLLDSNFPQWWWRRKVQSESNAPQKSYQNLRLDWCATLSAVIVLSLRTCFYARFLRWSDWKENQRAASWPTLSLTPVLWVTNPLLYLFFFFFWPGTTSFWNFKFASPPPPQREKRLKTAPDGFWLGRSLVLISFSPATCLRCWIFVLCSPGLCLASGPPGFDFCLKCQQNSGNSGVSGSNFWTDGAELINILLLMFPCLKCLQLRTNANKSDQFTVNLPFWLLTFGFELKWLIFLQRLT